MTRKQFRAITFGVMAIYALAIGAGVLLRLFAPGEYYSTYKDLIGLFVPIPAALLAFAFQRRLSYVQAVRSLWRTVLNSVHAARGYVLLPDPSARELRQVIEALRIALDEVRGVFRNLPVEGKQSGWYPYEPMRDILRVVEELGCGKDATPARREAAKSQIDDFWALVRDPLLEELEREVPTAHHAAYAPRRALPPLDPAPPNNRAPAQADVRHVGG